MAEGELRIGTSGWQYDHWRDVFYPGELSKKDWFSYYADHFDTVEVNNTFYHLPSEETFQSWHDQAPAGFLYALKFSRYGTQMKKLKDPDSTIGNFMDRAKSLEDHLGPVLVQLPPRWKPDVARLAAFLAAAPTDVRWAVEFRDASWLIDEVLETLIDHGAGLVIHDMIPDHPWVLTTDWMYLRFHGVDYSHKYSEDRLRSIARWIREKRDAGIDAYAYFNNDACGYAVSDATTLRQYVEE